MHAILSIARLWVAFMVAYFFISGLLLLLLSPEKYATLLRWSVPNMEDASPSRRRLWAWGFVLTGGWGLIRLVPIVIRHPWLTR